MSTGGWIFRDDQGFFLGGGQGKRSVNGDGSLETELQALLMAINIRASKVIVKWFLKVTTNRFRSY